MNALSINPHPELELDDTDELESLPDGVTAPRSLVGVESTNPEPTHDPDQNPETGLAVGAVGGGIVGAIVGGPVVAVIGAVVGGLAGGIGVAAVEAGLEAREDLAGATPAAHGANNQSALPETRSDPSGSTLFELHGYDQASTVFLVGDFNQWNRTGNSLAYWDGIWTVHKSLAPGKYLYGFDVNGAWVLDPANPETVINANGVPCSVCIVANEPISDF